MAASNSMANLNASTSSAATATAPNSAGPGTPAAVRVGRNPSFRIPLPPSSAVGASANNTSATSPSGGGSGGAFVPQSPGGSSSSRFGGLALGFRRNRGQSTSRDARNNDPIAAAGGPPSPPAFPNLASSVSQPNFTPGSSSPYFEGDHAAQAASGSSINANNSSNLSTSIPTGGARGYFSRSRGFAKKMAGGTRTPTGEAPPLLVRSRSSSQPSLPLNTQNQNPVPSTATGSFFPPQTSPALGSGGFHGAPAATDGNDAAQTSHSDVAEAALPNARPSTGGGTHAASAANPGAATETTSSSVPAVASGSTSTASAAANQHIRLVPHLESTRGLSFEPVSRDVAPTIPLRIGRFTDRAPGQPASLIDQNRVAFKSKVVSRTHAEIWWDPAPPAGANASASGSGWFIRDLKSSSGTFLNHIRLSGAGMESRPFPIRDGDVLQLGVDYQGGTEEIYRCVKIRVELNRAWQRGANNFNTNALRQIRALGNVGSATTTGTSASSAKAKKPKATRKNTAVNGEVSKPAPAPAAASSGVTDCCICLFGVTVYQALFIAPCSHIFHFKCIRPLLLMHHPGFSCPLCRTFADLEADVEQDDVVEPIEEEDDDEEEEEGEDEEEEEESAANQAPSLPETDAVIAGALDTNLVEASTSTLEQRRLESAVGTELAPPPFADYEANLETLRPNRKSPQIPQSEAFSSASGTTGTAAASPSHASVETPERPNGIRQTGRHSSSSLHHSTGSNGQMQGRISTDEAFFPPSAGDFEPDIRRTSIYVHGADGLPMQIPVTGRSRPGSVYDVDISDNANANASMNSGHARSIRSLRMSTNSVSSLRALHDRHSPGPASPPLQTAFASSHPRNATEYHDTQETPLSSDEEGDWEPPPTARADPVTGRSLAGSYPSVPAPASMTECRPLDSPTSVFTAPLAPASAETEGLPPSLPLDLGTLSLQPSLLTDDVETEQSQQTTPPSASEVVSGDLPGMHKDDKGKGRLANQEASQSFVESSAAIPSKTADVAQARRDTLA